MNLTYKTQTITPTVAEAMLAKAAPNRTINNAAVGHYKAVMLAGEWELNGEPIIIDTDGFLLDGQHRLWAVVESGVTITSLVVRGAARESFATIDTGTKRTAGQVLSMVGLKYANCVAAALRLLMDYESAGGLTRKRGRYSHKDVMSALKNNPNISLSAALATRCKMPRVLTLSTATFCHYLFAKRSATGAAEFFERLADGAGLSRGSPILALRTRLFKDAQAAARSDRYVQVELVFRAWNGFREGRSMSKMISSGNLPAVL